FAYLQWLERIVEILSENRRRARTTSSFLSWSLPLLKNSCFGNRVAVPPPRYHLPGGGAIPMLAFVWPRVFDTRDDTLDFPGERAATQRSADKLNLEIISTELNPEQGRQASLRLSLPSKEPAPYSLLSQSHRPSPGLREEV